MSLVSFVRTLKQKSLTAQFDNEINVKMPFKRYQIGEVFRDGPVEKARYRQFLQCDVDVIGVNGMNADAEIIALTTRAFKKLGFDAVIRVNNRKYYYKCHQKTKKKWIKKLHFYHFLNC